MTSGSPRRSDLDVIRQQLEAIEHWHATRRTALSAPDVAATSREAGMALARRMDILRAQHRAIVERTEQHLARSAELLNGSAPRRAVLAHRNAWFLDAVSAQLAAYGVDVVARLVNGAEAVGATLAEQPDLLLVEDSLPLVGGEDVVRQVRAYAPPTVVGAQVAYEDRIGALLDAGASGAWSRRVPPADVAAGLRALLEQAGPVAEGGRPAGG